MRRMRGWLASVALVGLAAGGCNRPSADECRQAAEQIFKIEGITESTGAPDPEAFVRKCRTQFSRDAVRCVARAKTRNDLDACMPEGKTKR